MRESEVGSAARHEPPRDDAVTDVARDDAAVVRHEEELEVGKALRDAGSLRARKHVESERVSETHPRRIEHLDDVERVPAGEHDSGEIETLPDGSVSIPILEEELVVTKRTVVRERVVIRKRTETEHRRVDAELRKERVEIDVDESVELRPHEAA